jgi:hypothetical protein
MNHVKSMLASIFVFLGVGLAFADQPANNGKKDNPETTTLPNYEIDPPAKPPKP